MGIRNVVLYWYAMWLGADVGAAAAAVEAAAALVLLLSVSFFFIPSTPHFAIADAGLNLNLEYRQLVVSIPD